MSHYAVLVIGEDWEGQLAPFDERLEVESDEDLEKRRIKISKQNKKSAETRKKREEEKERKEYERLKNKFENN